MSAHCPKCGESYFICGFCNSELSSIEAVLMEENSCKFHYCSSDCITEDVRLLERRKSHVDSGRKLAPLLTELKPVSS